MMFNFAAKDSRNLLKDCMPVCKVDLSVVITSLQVILSTASVTYM
jgi:hypothetical protein